MGLPLLITIRMGKAHEKLESCRWTAYRVHMIQPAQPRHQSLFSNTRIIQSIDRNSITPVLGWGECSIQLLCCLGVSGCPGPGVKGALGTKCQEDPSTLGKPVRCCQKEMSYWNESWNLFRVFPLRDVDVPGAPSADGGRLISSTDLFWLLPLPLSKAMPLCVLSFTSPTPKHTLFLYSPV